MLCPNCKRKIKKNLKFCPKCGIVFFQENSHFEKSSCFSYKRILVVLFLCIVLLTGLEIFYLVSFDEVQVPILEEEKKEETVDPSLDYSYDKSGAFLFQVRGSLIHEEKGFFVGKVLRGTVQVGDEIFLYGETSSSKTVLDIKRNGKSLSKADMGDEVQIILMDVTSEDVLDVQVLASPNSVKSFQKFSATITLYDSSFLKYSTFDFDFKQKVVSGDIDFSSSETLNGTVFLKEKVYFGEGGEFDLLVDGVVVGNGVITKI